MPPYVKLLYLVGAILFISGLKRLSSPATARSGNQMSAVGMLIAIITTVVYGEIASFPMIIGGIVLGSAIGAVMARTIQMTDMPQMVALLNGFGGGASALVAASEFLRYVNVGTDVPINIGVSIQLSVLIGALTFSGSLINTESWMETSKCLPT